MKFEKNYSWSEVNPSLLSINQQLNLWSDIIPNSQLFKKIQNPFRDDKHSGCWLELLDSDVVLVDYAYKQFHNMSVYVAYKKKYNSLTKQEIFNKLAENIGLKSVDEYKIVTRKKVITDITYTESKSIPKKTIQYLSSYGITVDQLKEDNIIIPKRFVITQLYDNGEDRITEYTPNEVCLLFKFNKRCKIYYPLRTNYKWKSNTTIEDCWKIDVESDIVLIGSSWKDIRVASNEFHIDGFAFQNEGISSLKKDDYDWLSKHSIIILAGDNDKAGQEFNKKLLEIFPNAFEFQYPEIDEMNSFGKKNKDLSEIYRHNKQLLQDGFRNTIELRISA